MEILQTFKTASYHMKKNDHFIVIVSQNRLTIYSSENGAQINKIEMKNPLNTCFINDDLLLVKMISGDYKICNIKTGEIQTVLFKQGKVSEFIEPIFIEGGYFCDYQYRSPTQQLFIFNPTVKDSKRHYLNYSGGGNIKFLCIDKIKNCIVIGDQKDQTSTISFLPVTSFGDVDVINLDIFTWYTYYNQGEKSYLLVMNKSANLDRYDISQKTYVKDFIQLGQEVAFYKIAISSNNKFILFISIDSTHLYSLETGIKICGFYCKYNHFASFCDNDTALLMGTWKKGYYMNFEPSMRHTNIYLE